MFGFHFWQALFEGGRWARYRGGVGNGGAAEDLWCEDSIAQSRALANQFT